MQKSVQSQVLRIVETEAASEKLRAADGRDRFGEELFHNHLRVSTRAIANRDVDAVLHKVRQLHGCRDMHVDLGMAILKAMKSRKEPFHCEGGCNADRQQARFAQRTDGVDGEGKTIKAFLDPRQSGLPCISQHEIPADSTKQG